MPNFEKRFKYFVSVKPDQARIHRSGMHVALTGHTLQMTYIYMPPFARVDWHSHEEESFITVIEGGFEMWVADEHFHLTPGSACWIPANTPHRAIVGREPTIEIEAFSPPREDWAAITPNLDFRSERISK
jgi:quercetin dioxygenase-like cupin family protein